MKRIGEIAVVVASILVLLGYLVAFFGAMQIINDVLEMDRRIKLLEEQRK